MIDIQLKFFHKQTGHPHVQQYFILRDVEYKDKLKLKKFSGVEDEYDQDSHILIATIGDDVIGGMRLVISDNSKMKLPMEDDNFRLKNLFPNKNLENCKYAEVSRFAIKDEFRSARLAKEICDKIFLDKLFELNVRYGFCVSKIEIAKAARMLCKKIGLNMEMRKEINVPNFDTYENLEMYLSIIDLTHLYSIKQEDVIQKSA